MTLCSHDRLELFGVVEQSAVQLNSAGSMILDVWNALPAFYPGVTIDCVVVMPNHVHGVLVLTSSRADGHVPGNDTAARSLQTERARSLGDVVRLFKTLTTNRYADGVRQNGWRSFRDRLWQRNYYEHVVRSDGELDAIRAYILENPVRWATDPEHGLR